MAGKLSEIRASSPAATITGAELVEVTQSGTTKAATVAEILGAQSLDGLSDVAVAGAAQGAILYRAAAGWVHLPAGAAGQVLTTAGAGVDPAWAAVAGQATVTSVTASSGSVSLDASSASASATFRVLVNQPITLNITGADDGQRITIELTQDATGGRLVTLGSMFAFGADLTSFTASTAGAKTDILGVQYHAASSKYRVLAASKGF